MSKNKIPQSPEEWDDANNTLYRHFEFTSTPDIKILIRLVKENIPDRGNSRYTRTKLLGILMSQFSRQNKRFWVRHYHPKTWRIRLAYSRAKELIGLYFNTKSYRGQVMLCNMARDVVKEEQAAEV